MRPVILTALIVTLFSGATLACSCADVSPRSCNLTADADASISVGTVVGVENPPHEGDNSGGTARYHFSVEEWLSPDVRSEVEVLSGRGGADCSFWFQTGIRYLVFASRSHKDELWTNVCSNTQRAEYAGPLLTQLRAMHDRQPVARVYGAVRQVQQPYGATYQPDFDKPLPQLLLHFESSHGRIDAQTDDDGSFAVYDLPSGTYKITADLRADLEIAQTILTDPPPSLQLDSDSCVKRDIEVLPSGKIRGYSRAMASHYGMLRWNCSLQITTKKAGWAGGSSWTTKRNTLSLTM